MKKIIISFALFPVVSAFAQNSDIPLGLVEYQEKILLIKQTPEEESKYSIHNFELYFGNNSSLYVPIPSKLTVKYTDDTDTSGVSKKLLDKIVEKAISPVKIKSGSSRLKKYVNTILLTQEITQEGEKFVIVDTLEKINWMLISESKVIAGQNCKKAIGVFRGRTYEAWYALEIPVPAGPWNLYGLPGLILEASDVKNEVFFNTKSIIIPSAKNKLIPSSFEGKEISEDLFRKKDLEQLKKYENMLRALNKENRVSYTGTTVLRELKKH